MPALHWDDFWLGLAEQVAVLSKDPSTKVGALIVTPDNKQCSIGYNGFPAGIEEESSSWERPEKYEWVIHAEKNAVANCPFPTTGCSLYVTHQPCHICMGFLRNAGINHIVFRQRYANLKRPDIWMKIREGFSSVICIDSNGVTHEL